MNRSTFKNRVVGAMLCVLWHIGLLCVSTGYAAELTSVALSFDKRTLILGDRIGNISAWSFESREKLWQVKGSGRPIQDISEASSNWVIAVDGPDAVCMVLSGDWKLTSFFDYRITLEGQPSATAAAAFKEGGGTLVVAGSHFAEIFLLDVFTFVERDFQRTIVLKDFETRTFGEPWMGMVLAQRMEPLTSRAVLGQLRYEELEDSWKDLAFCSKGKRVVGVSRKGYLVAWDIEGSQPGAPRKWDPTFIRQVGSNKDPERSLNGVACTASGRIATAGVPGRFGALQVWNSEGEMEYFAPSPEGTNPSERIERVAFDRQGQYILSSGRAGYTLWRLTDNAAVVSATIRPDNDNFQGQSGRPIVGLDDGRFLLLSGEGAWLLDGKSRTLTRSFGPRPSGLKVNPK